MQRIAKLVSGRLRAQPVGPHPDADLLSAFAENALLDTERNHLLRHLEVCADCREILYLAMPGTTDLQKVLSLRPSRSPWFALRWGALAASVVVVAGIFVARYPLFHTRYQPSKIAIAPAPTPYANMSEKKVPPALDAMRDDRAVQKPAPPVMTAERPEPKHMTAKPQAILDFEESGQVRVSAAPNPNQTTSSRVQNLPLQGGNEISLTDPPASEGNAARAPRPMGATAKDKDAIESADRSLGLFKKESTAKGDVSGTVVDPSGSVVANAKVTMGGPIGTKTATSDPTGRFSFDLLTPGSYTIKAEAPGFKTTEIKQVAVLDNKTPAMRVTLQPGSAAEAVEVSAAAAGVDETVVATGAAPVLDASTGFVAERQQTAAQLSPQKTATEERSRREGIGSGTRSPQLQWSLSPDGTVQRSESGGRTWQSVSVGTGATFRALSGMGANVWVGGKAGALYHSGDSGESWTRIVPVVGEQKLRSDISHIDFSDALNGAVSTTNGEVWTTSDGGRTWQRK